MACFADGAREPGHRPGAGARHARAATAPPTSRAPTSCPPPAPGAPSRSSTRTTSRRPRPTSPPTAASSACPPCTTANGCFSKVNQNGGTTPPAGQRRLGRGDRARPRHGLRGLSAVQDPARRGDQPDHGQPRHRRQPGGHAWARSRSPTATAAARAAATRRFDNPYYKHAGVGDHRSQRRQRLRRRATPPPRRTSPSVGGTSLSHAAQRARLDARRCGAAPAAAARSTRPSRPSSTTPAARGATMADVSAVADPNTGVAVYDTLRRAAAGWSSAGPARRRRSSPRSSRWRPAGRAASTRRRTRTPTPSALFDVTSGSNGSCSPAYLCTGSAGYDGPTGLGTPNGVAAFGPARLRPRTTSRSRSARPRGRSRPAPAATATVSTATTSGSAQSVSLSASGLPTGAARVVLPGIGHLRRLVDPDAHARRRSTPAGTYAITITATGTSATHTTTYTLTVNGVSGCASPGQKLANPGFESGAASWTATSGVIGQWGASGQPTHGGTWDAWLDGYGTHAHRHGVAERDDPERLLELHAVVLAAHRLGRDDDERRSTTSSP